MSNLNLLHFPCRWPSFLIWGSGITTGKPKAMRTWTVFRVRAMLLAIHAGFLEPAIVPVPPKGKSLIFSKLHVYRRPILLEFHRCVYNNPATQFYVREIPVGHTCCKVFFPWRLMHPVGAGMIKTPPWEVCHPNLLRTLLSTTSEWPKSKGMHRLSSCCWAEQ